MCRSGNRFLTASAISKFVNGLSDKKTTSRTYGPGGDVHNSCNCYSCCAHAFRVHSFYTQIIHCAFTVCVFAPVFLCFWWSVYPIFINVFSFVETELTVVAEQTYTRIRQSWAVFEILVFEIRILNTFSIQYLVFEILTVEYFVFRYFKYFFFNGESILQIGYCIQNTFFKILFNSHIA